MMDREDQLDKHYISIERCDKWTERLFWLCALFSVGVPYSNIIPIVWLQQVLGILFIVTVAAYSVLSHYNGFCLIPYAENLRRKQLLSDALGVPLTSEQTKGYYNNEITPSITRLGASILENSFFAKNVCYEMAKTERLKVFIYFLFWIAAISCRNIDLGLVLILTQVLFSSEILIRLIKIEILRSHNVSIYNDLYSHFLNRVSPSYLPGIAILLHSFASYESAKSAASIKQSSKIFHKLNPKLSAEWEDIRKQLGIDKWDSNQALEMDWAKPCRF